MHLNNDLTDNQYALNEKNEIIYIFEAESGKKGYYCKGCGREMQAKKSTIQKSYFAHDPKDVLLKGKCTFSDETYRHILAKDILQRIKEIKVPALYKLPPQGIDAMEYKIRDAWTITAHSVRNELSFYENENGEIAWGRDIDFGKDTNKFLYIIPDVSFFDVNGNPILLIEIVATHKIEADKLSKIKNLGIDTVQVLIPKSSPEEIENTFYITSRTEWVYNHEQEQTKYIFTPQGSNQGILPISIFQRNLLKAEESFNCRASQLRNFIRGITKNLESESYRKSYEYFRDEIQRVEGNTEIARNKSRELEREIQENIATENRHEILRVKTERERIEEGIRKLEQEKERIIERFHKATGELAASQREYRAECQTEIDRIEDEFRQRETSAITVDERRTEIIKLSKRDEEFFRIEDRRIESEIIRARANIRDIIDRRNSLSSKYSKIEESIKSEYRIVEEKLREQFEADYRRIESEAEELRRRTIEAITNRDCQSIPELNGRIRAILDAGKSLSYIPEGKSYLGRLKIAKELLQSGAWKKWT